MTVYAIFLCIAAINRCEPQVGPGGLDTFRSRAECERFIPGRGRIYPNPYRCMSRRVEVWK